MSVTDFRHPSDIATAPVHEILASLLADPDTSWSLGTFGVPAEFHRTPDEPALVNAGVPVS